MIILQTVLAFIIALSVLIMVHELGHYWVARLCNVKVLRFSLGMGKIVFSRRFGPDQTEWALSIVPVGGYVKLLDARTEDLSTLPPEERKRDFTGKSVWCRIAIVAAGPLANFLLAIILLAGLYMYGVPEPLARLRPVPENTVAWEAGLRGGERIVGINGVSISSWQDIRWKLLEALMEDLPVVLEIQSAGALSDEKSISRTVALPITHHHVGELNAGFLDRFGLALARPPAVVGKVMPDGPAGKAGLQTSDHIVSINGEPLVDGLDFIQKVRASPGNPLVFGVVRDRKHIELTVVPQGHEEKGAVVGKIQAEIPIVPEMVVVRHGFFSSFGKGAVKAWETTALTLKMLGRMFTGKVSIKNITGPISIADYAGQTARAGLIRYLYFLAFISISIGVMNLLPIPVLDGGLLLYYAVEVISGRSISERASGLAQRIGIAVLVLLLVVAVFNDLSRLTG
jgi:regulator of sigma E protease